MTSWNANKEWNCHKSSQWMHRQQLSNEKKIVVKSQEFLRLFVHTNNMLCTAVSDFTRENDDDATSLAEQRRRKHRDSSFSSSIATHQYCVKSSSSSSGDISLSPLPIRFTSWNLPTFTASDIFITRTKADRYTKPDDDDVDDNVRRDKNTL